MICDRPTFPVVIIAMSRYCGSKALGKARILRPMVRKLGFAKNATVSRRKQIGLEGAARIEPDRPSNFEPFVTGKRQLGCSLPGSWQRTCRFRGPTAAVCRFDNSASACQRNPKSGTWGTNPQPPVRLAAPLAPNGLSPQRTSILTRSRGVVFFAPRLGRSRLRIKARTLGRAALGGAAWPSRLGQTGG